MTKIKMVKLLAMQCVLVLVGSCIKAPVDIALKEKIEISEEQIREIADEIYDNLAEIDFASPPPPTIDPKECRAAYKVWLRKQFYELGYIPNDIVLAAEYGISSTNPAIHECKSIDFKKEYEDAIKKRTDEQKTKRKAMVIDVTSFRDKLLTNKCTERLLDLDKEKIEIKDLIIHVVENTLSVKAPRYKLFTSYEDSIKDEIEETVNAEETMMQKGTLMFLGETRIIDRRFVGKLPVELNSNQDDYFQAEGPIVSLGGSLLAIPTTVASEAETTTIRDREYFIVPKGKLSLTLAVNLDVRLTTYDAKCAFDRLKEAIREEEAKREREEEEKRKKEEAQEAK